jgi:N-acetylneuraminic acid mutarotase
MACSSNDDLVGDWAISRQFPGKARVGAVSFVIGDKAYVGLGIDQENYEKSDFWEFNGTQWRQVAPFLGAARYGAVAFSDGQYGYVGLGYAPRTAVEGGSILKEEWFTDFWRFDPEGSTTDPTDPEVIYAGSWTKIESPFRGRTRIFATAFYLPGTGKAYVGTGRAESNYGTLADMWEFDVESQTWATTEYYPGFNSREGAVNWVMNGCAYIALGVTGTSYANDVWRFDPTQPEGLQWVELDKLKDTKDIKYDKHYPNIIRKYAVAFVVGEGSAARAYIAAGSSTTLKSDAWEYDPTRENGKGRWEDVTGMPVQRQQAVAFVINGVPYVTTGGASIESGNQSTYTFTPNVDDDEYNND